MSVEKSYARLGFFIFVSLLVILVTAVFFIQRLKRRPAMGMVTYTTENVFGLDVSSPVRLTGVQVGRVTDIRVDPRGKVVEIDFEVFLDRLNNIGVNVKRLQTITDIGGVFPRLRAQLMGNPMTGAAYLLLDQPKNPPPPMELGFKPNRLYVPSMPSPFALVEDRVPQLLTQADATLQTLREIVAILPDSIDRGNRFLTNADRIMRESELPALSAGSRKFFTTTSAQIEQIKSEMDGVIGTEGALIKLSEEARAAIKAADLPAATQSAREAADNSRLASDDLRRSLPAILDSVEQMSELARQLQEQPESVVYGPRQGHGKNKSFTSIRGIRVVGNHVHWDKRLPSASPQGDTCPHDRTATDRATTRRPRDTSGQESQRRHGPAARYASPGRHRPHRAAPATGWRADRRFRLALVIPS